MERHSAGLLIPLHDGTLSLLRKHRARIERKIPVALAGETALAVSRWLESSGRLPEAVKFLREAAAQNPQSVGIRRRLAGIYIQTGQVAEARNELSAIIEQPGAGHINLCSFGLFGRASI